MFIEFIHYYTVIVGLSRFVPGDHSSKDTEAIMYFDFLLPRLKEAYPDVAIPDEWHQR